MTHIRCKKGLDLKIEGAPSGEVGNLEANGRRIKPTKIALNLSSFEDVRFKLLHKKGEKVQIGQPLVLEKGTPGRQFLSPAAGVISEIQRGDKRRILNIDIDLAEKETVLQRSSIDPNALSREELAKEMLERGLFAYLRQRPFNRLADPSKAPRATFVKAIESAPFHPSAEVQVMGYEEDFQTGLDALSKLTEGPVHLVYRKDSNCKAFTEAKGVERHTAEGPHPIGTHSVHIHEISPISDVEDSVWTAETYDVVAIGLMLRTGKPLLEKVIGIGGPGILPGMRGYFKVRVGTPVANLITGRMPKGKMRLISGNPLMGEEVAAEQFLGFPHQAFTVLPEPKQREFLHFFRLGLNKFTASGAYLSGLLKSKSRWFPFTSSKHGEHRFFVTGAPYDAVMPMRVPTMQLVKAVMAEDFDLAEELGFLEVAPEDFALPTFVCPCKVEMVHIIKEGLGKYSSEVIG